MKKIFSIKENGKEILFATETIAKEQANARNCKLFTVAVTEKDFKNLIKKESFADTKTYLAELAKTTSPEQAKQTKQNETKLLKKQIAELTKGLQKIAEENKALRKKQLNISIEEASKLYERKASLLKYYKTFKNKRAILNNLQIEDFGGFDDSEVVKFAFFNKTGYSDNKMLSIANVDVVNKIKEYVIKLIDNKISEIETELTVLT